MPRGRLEVLRKGRVCPGDAGGANAALRMEGKGGEGEGSPGAGAAGAGRWGQERAKQKLAGRGLAPAVGIGVLGVTG